MDGGGCWVQGGWQVVEESEVKLWVEFRGSWWCVEAVGGDGRRLCFGFETE